MRTNSLQGKSIRHLEISQPANSRIVELMNYGLSFDWGLRVKNVELSKFSEDLIRMQYHFEDFWSKMLRFGF